MFFHSGGAYSIAASRTLPACLGRKSHAHRAAAVDTGAITASESARLFTQFPTGSDRGRKPSGTAAAYSEPRDVASGALLSGSDRKARVARAPVLQKSSRADFCSGGPCASRGPF